VTGTTAEASTHQPNAHRLWEAYGRGSALLFMSAPSACIDLAPHGALTLSGEPFLEMNWGVVDAGEAGDANDAPDDGAAAATLVRRFVATIRDRRLDAYLMATSAAAPHLEAAISELGLALDPGAPLMVRRRTAEHVFAIEQDAVTVEHVDDEWALRDMAVVLSKAFAAPPGVVERAFTPAMLSLPGLDVFVLRLKGEAVSAVVTTRHDDLLGFWAMGTIPEARRQRFGRRLLEAVIDIHSTRPGAPRWFFLTASSMGRPLYEKVGFTVADDSRFVDVLAAPHDEA
jgi:GNAT superfamily N-acetyltransferase